MSTIRVELVQPAGGGTGFPANNIAKAWVNYGTLTSTLIYGAENIASVTDNGVGDTTVALVNPMGDTFYACTMCGTPGFSDTNHSSIISWKTGSSSYRAGLKLTNRSRFQTSSSSNGAGADGNEAHISWMGDLA